MEEAGADYVDVAREAGESHRTADFHGTDTSDLSRQVGAYTGRILKGDNPADMPVQQATKVELSINLKTAKMLGLTIPLPLIARAEQVIE